MARAPAACFSHGCQLRGGQQGCGEFVPGGLDLRKRKLLSLVTSTACTPGAGRKEGATPAAGGPCGWLSLLPLLGSPRPLRHRTHAHSLVLRRWVTWCHLRFTDAWSATVSTSFLEFSQLFRPDEVEGILRRALLASHVEGEVWALLASGDPLQPWQGERSTPRCWEVGQWRE